METYGDITESGQAQAEVPFECGQSSSHQFVLLYSVCIQVQYVPISTPPETRVL
jgi:hypothetical protein